MPSRGSYQITPGVDPDPPPAKPSARQHFVDPEKCHPPSRPDTSFRDCVLSLALVLLIIAILVLVVRPWSDNNDHAHHGAAAAHGRHNQSKSTTTVSSTTTSPAATVTTTKTTTPDNGHGDDFDQGSKSSSTTKETPTTTLNIERHGEPVTNVDDNEEESVSKPVVSTTSTETSTEYHENGGGDQGSNSSSTTKATPTTTLNIERHGEPVTNVDDNEDEPVSSPVETTTTTEASPEYPVGESEGLAETTTRSQPTPDLYPTVHRAETTTPSPTDDDQYMRKPLTKPIADNTDDTDAPTTTMPSAQESEEDTAPWQVQVGVITTESASEIEKDSTTDVDFGLAVANYQPTTTQGDDGVTTEQASESVGETTFTTRQHERLAKLLVAGEKQADETTTDAVQELTESSQQETTLEELDPKPRECSTPACKKQAARMLGLMDHSTEPCQDFYQYACGGLRDNSLLAEEDADAEAMARIEGELSKVDNGTSSAALRTFRRFYDLCVEDVGDKDKRIDKFSTSARDAVQSVGKLHTRASWTSEKLDLTDLLTKLMLQHSTPLIDVTLDVSSSAAGKFALKLTPPVTPSLLRPGPARPSCNDVAPEEMDLNVVYRSYLNCTANHSRYMQEVEAAVKALRLFPQVNTTHREQLVLEIRQTIEWDVWDSDLLMELPAEGEKRRKLLAKEYESTTVRGLQDKYPMVNWRRLLSGLLRVDITELPDSAEVQVYFQPYLDKLFDGLMSKDPRALHNALLAMYARDLYAHALIGGPRCQRKDRCLRVAVALMEDVASLLYLSSFNSNELDAMEQESNAAFTRLRETLELQLKDAKWLDEGSRSDIVAKLHQMRIDSTGGREFFTDIALVDGRVSGIDLEVSNDLIKLSAALTARYRQLMYSLYDKNPNSTEVAWTFFLLPFSTSAVSVYGLNSVMVPFGQLIWPLYDPAVPRHVTLARLGFVIAHEMAHHFDSIGINYRAGRGRGDSVLMGTASRVFNEYLEVTCPVHMRYNFDTSHTEPDKSTYKFNLDGAKLSRNERLADDTANALSLDTGVRWQQSTAPDPSMPYLGLTTAQEHFLAVAQMFCSKSGVSSWRVGLFEREHPPPPHRVNDMFKNSAAFADAFKCPHGHYMSPEVRCEVFPALPDDEEYDGGPQAN